MTDSIPRSACAAERMRRHRERIKRGSVFVRFEMTSNAVDQLIALGWLKPESRRDPYIVTSALIEFGTRALWPNDDL